MAIGWGKCASALQKERKKERKERKKRKKGHMIDVQWEDLSGSDNANRKSDRNLSKFRSGFSVKK
jgi:hypothetical protein